MDNLKYEHQIKSENYDHGESNIKNEDEKCTIINEHHNLTNSENSYNNGEDSHHNDAVNNEYEDFNYEIQHDICNRENQWYAFFYIIIY